MAIIKQPSQEQAIKFLTEHKDPAVQVAGKLINEALVRRKGLLGLVQEALQQLRLDMKYIIFDLECTRKERDALKAGD